MGVGLKEGEKSELGRLSRLGFTRLSDCLFSVPKEYRDHTKILDVLPVADTGERVTLRLDTVSRTGYDSNRNTTSFWPKMARLVVRCTDECGQEVTLAVFGNVWPWKDIKMGQEVVVYGELTTFRQYLQINSPILVPEYRQGKVVPVYVGKPGQVSGDKLAVGVANALPLMDEAACMLPARLGIREEDFPAVSGIRNPSRLFKTLHQPQTLAEGVAAKTVARKLSALALVRLAAANKNIAPVIGSSIPVNRDRVGELARGLPYSLTEDQKQAIREIVADLRSPYPMKRLLSGDVGTGKSLTFFLPAVAAHEAGARVAVLAPTQLLVTQLARELREFFPGTPVCEVMSGGKIGDGIVVGTVAVLTAAAKAKVSFGLVIADEQHKFSTGQKNALLSSHTNILESTATAIPRTLALVGFGGMPVSVLRECPVKKEVTTKLVEHANGAKLFAFVEGIAAKGGQIAVIYPIVGDGSDQKSVGAAGARWEKRFPGRVGVLHGQMKDDEKRSVIEVMQAGKLDILISSTVIETGITLPALKAVVVVNPERYGVSQLHQLRGRVARKGGKGYFFMLMPEPKPKEKSGEPGLLLALDEEEGLDARERLNLLVECSDGFTLAERDMELRGFGNVESGGDTQTGTTYLLFWGVRLIQSDIEEAAAVLNI